MLSALNIAEKRWQSVVYVWRVTLHKEALMKEIVGHAAR